MDELLIAIHTLNMKKYSEITITLGIVALFLFGCLSASNQITPPGGYSQAFWSLDSTIVLNLSEQARLTTSSVKGPVAVANYFPGKDMLLAVYSGDGFLRAWGVGDVNILFEHDLGIASNIGVGLDQSGDLVIGAMQHIVKENDPGEFREYVGGITLWSTETGKIVECVRYPCERTGLQEQSQPNLIGAVLDSKGRWVLMYSEIIISQKDLTGVQSSSSSIRDFITDNYKYPSLAVFDPNKDRYAIAFTDGEVLIKKNEENYAAFGLSHYLGTYKEDSRHEVTALSFSPDGQLLARIQDNVLTAWLVTPLSGKIQIEHEIPDGHFIAFDQSSEMLFTGTNENVEVWDIKEGKSIGEFSTPGITSLSVSSDNRLLIWGDQSGVIHVWGIRK